MKSSASEPGLSDDCVFPILTVDGQILELLTVNGY